MKKKIFAAIAAALTLSLSAGSAVMAEASLDTENPIKIGYIGALSGDTALWGQAGLNGMELTAKQINEAGGILGREVQIIGLDGKGAPDDSVTAYKKLVEQEGVCAVVGTNFSSCSIPIAAVADELKVPAIATAASNEQVTVDSNGNLHPYSFRLCFIDSYMGYLAGNYAYTELGLKTAALITDITDSYSTNVGQYMIDTFKDLGGEVVAQEEAQNGDNDFRAQLTKIAAAQPDVLFIPWNYENVCLIAQQARELGITSVFFGADGNEDFAAADYYRHFHRKHLCTDRIRLRSGLQPAGLFKLGSRRSLHAGCVCMLYGYHHSEHAVLAVLPPWHWRSGSDQFPE